jgi:hypothetical protein
MPVIASGLWKTFQQTVNESDFEAPKPQSFRKWRWHHEINIRSSSNLEDERFLFPAGALHGRSSGRELRHFWQLVGRSGAMHPTTKNLQEVPEQFRREVWWHHEQAR